MCFQTKMYPCKRTLGAPVSSLTILFINLFLIYLPIISILYCKRNYFLCIFLATTVLALLFRKEQLRLAVKFIGLNIMIWKIWNVVWKNRSKKIKRLLCNIYRTGKRSLPRYQNTEKCVEKRGRRPSFLTISRIV